MSPRPRSRGSAGAERRDPSIVGRSHAAARDAGSHVPIAQPLGRGHAGSASHALIARIGAGNARRDELAVVDEPARDGLAVQQDYEHGHGRGRQPSRRAADSAVRS